MSQSMINFVFIEWGFALKKRHLGDKIKVLLHHRGVTRSKNSIILEKTLVRSSPPEVIWRKSVLRNVAKFTGKHLRQGLFFNKVAGRPATLLKKRLCRRCFPVNFAKILSAPFFTEHFWWLLLIRVSAVIFTLFRELRNKRDCDNFNSFF